MGKIERVERETGARSDMGDYEGEILGQPFICVYGKSKPRTNGELVSLPLCGDMRMYIRYMSAPELNKHLSDKEGTSVEGTVVLNEGILNYLHKNASEEFKKGMEFMESTEISQLSMIDFMIEKGLPKEIAKCIPEDDPQRKMIIVGTKHHGGQFGAGVLACKKVLEDIREKVGDYYIIPSSIHEIIVLPKALGERVDGLVEMVKLVNRTEVEPQDVLADEVYYFDENGLQVANF